MKLLKLFCPTCRNEIKPENVNVSTDLAKCENCNELYRASQLVKPNISVKEKPPNGSNIILKEGLNNKIEIVYPKKGISMPLLPQLFFNTVWLGFLAFWTFGTFPESIFFTIFSIPFWIYGLISLNAMLNSINEIQSIIIIGDKLIFQKERLINSKLFESKLEDIVLVSMKGMKDDLPSSSNQPSKLNWPGTSGTPLNYPAIITGRKTQYFFETANDAEQAWIVQYLDHVIKKRTR